MPVLLVLLTPFLCKSVHISLDSAVRWSPPQSLACMGYDVDQGCFLLVNILAKASGLTEDRESISKDNDIGIGSEEVVSDLICCFWMSFSFRSAVGGVLSCGYRVMCASPSLYLMYTLLPLISGSFCRRSVFEGMGNFGPV